MGVVEAPGTVAVFCKGEKRPHLHRSETAHHIRVCGYKPFQFFSDRVERNTGNESAMDRTRKHIRAREAKARKHHREINHYN